MDMERKRQGKTLKTNHVIVNDKISIEQCSCASVDRIDILCRVSLIFVFLFSFSRHSMFSIVSSLAFGFSLGPKNTHLNAWSMVEVLSFNFDYMQCLILFRLHSHLLWYLIMLDLLLANKTVFEHLIIINR